MKLISDSKGRITSVELFPPYKPFSAERQPDGSIRIVELIEKEPPIVKSRRNGKGFLMSPVKLDRKSIIAAIRADRDSR